MTVATPESSALQPHTPPPTRANQSPREKTAPSASPSTIQRPDRSSRAIIAGTLGVAGAAALLSFATLRGLAGLIDYPPVLTPALPVVIDLYAAVVAWVWLGAGDRDPELRTWAKRNTVFGIGASIALNTLYHAILSGAFTHPVRAIHGLAAPTVWHSGLPPGIEVDLWVVIVVSATPPIALGLTIHLLTMLFGGGSHLAASTVGQPPVGDGESTVVVGRAVAPNPAPDLNKRPAIPARKRELSAAPSRTVVPIGEMTERKAAVFARLDQIVKDGGDTSRPGLNDELKNEFDVAKRTVELWKKDWKESGAP